MHASDELDGPAQGTPGWDKKRQADGEEDVGGCQAVLPGCGRQKFHCLPEGRRWCLVCGAFSWWPALGHAPTWLEPGNLRRLPCSLEPLTPTSDWANFTLNQHCPHHSSFTAEYEKPFAMLFVVVHPPLVLLPND